MSRASHKKAAATMSRTSRLLHFKCMKKNTTSVAFRTAMAMATTVFPGPKS